MADRVVDASALAALLFAEAEAASIAAAIRGMRLIAPAILGFELANVCLMKCRHFPDRREDFLASYAAVQSLGVQELPVDHDAVLALAAATRLTHYDAAYLWLSRRTGAALVSLDRALLAAI